MRVATLTLFAMSNLLLLPGALFAQNKECWDQIIQPAVQAAMKTADRTTEINNVRGAVFNAGIDAGCQALMLGKPQTHALALKQLTSATQNQTQTGANASNSGTTNLVSKNLSPLLLSMASEYGGMTQSTSGQTTTFSGTLSGIPLATESHTGIAMFAECTAKVRPCIDPTTLDWLSKFSYSVALSTGGTAAGSGTAGTGQGNAQPVTLSGTGSASNYNVTQVTGKFAILRQYGTQKAIAAAADNIDKASATAIRQSALDLFSALKVIDSPDSGSDADKDLNSAAAALLDADTTKAWDDAATTKAWNEAAAHLTAAARLAKDPNGKKVDDVVNAYLQALMKYTAQEDLAFETTEKPTLSFEYDLNRPTNQPTNSNFKLVLGWNSKKTSNAKASKKSAAPGQKGAAQPAASGQESDTTDTTGPWTITANATASIYNSPPSTSIPSANRLRDIQLAAEVDYKLSNSLPILGKPTFSGAFYYQDQTSPSILKVPISGLPITGLSSSTNQVFTQRGPIDIGQFKVSFGTTNSGISVPLSITIANRTELLTGMDVRGQVGLTYSFDSLLGKK